MAYLSVSGHPDNTSRLKIFIKLIAIAMLRLLRKIRLTLIESSSFRKYILYAIGEIALVVIGILIALQINNWNVSRLEHKLEDNLLKELRNDIKNNYQVTQWAIEGNKSAQTSCEIILAHMDKNLSFHDSLAFHFENANVWWVHLVRKSAYENIKSYGIQFVKDDTLRQMLSNLFEQRATFTLMLNERQTLYYYNTVAPILTELFESIYITYGSDGKGIKPIDFEQLKQNQKYRNILKTSIKNRQNDIKWITGSYEMMIEIDQRILKEINSR